MAQIKCTKIELVRLRKKLGLFLKYLPTLQLKKMLLQTEVNKARDEVRQLTKAYEAERAEASKHAHLLTDPSAQEIVASIEIAERVTREENIAGIIVPILDKLVFNDRKLNVMRTPLWMDDAVALVQRLSHVYQRVEVAKKKQAILENELRIVSIRVNLFEKRMIPQLEREIGQIRVFLGDQELQAVGQAKVSKRKKKE